MIVDARDVLRRDSVVTIENPAPLPQRPLGARSRCARSLWSLPSHVWTLLLGILLTCNSLSAQRVVEPKFLLGKTVRIEARKFGTAGFEGSVISADSNNITFVPVGGVSAAIPVREINRLLVQTRAGAPLLGGALGFVVGGVTGVVSCQTIQARAPAPAVHDSDILRSVGICLPAGSLIGAFVGARVARTRWKEVRLGV